MFLEPLPADFKPIFDVVSCYVRSGSDILVLRRSLNKKRQPGLWGLPAGRADQGEDKVSAMIRELEEETGLKVSAGDLRYHEAIPVRNNEKDGYDLWYHVFELKFENRPQINISDEHTEYRWVEPLQVLKLELIHDLDLCIQRHTFLRS